MSAPLILAIQPDRRQASQLASIVRGLSAEMILAETAEKAIAELGDRPPDLILTPALLSVKDEKRLTDRLHEFGDAAAHTQTLTTPIFETEASPARGKGMLSSLRKPKKKGKAQEVGSAADTFAEQITIYLKRAVEGRRARPKKQTSASASKAQARSEAVVEAPVAEAPATVPDVAALDPPVETIDPVSAIAATPVQESPTQADPAPVVDRPAAGDGLPTIEELSARTPSVPEPDTSVEANIDAIAAMVPADGAVIDRSIPLPEATPTVGELQVDVPAMETASVGDEAPAVPESAGQIDTTMEAVAAMVPIDSADAGDRAVPMPDAMPAVADVSMELPTADIAVHGDAMPSAPQLDDAVDMTMDAVAAAVPIADVSAHIRPVPMPAAMPKVADLAMELPAAELAPTVDALPFAPDLAEAGIDAVAAMMPIVSSASDDRLVPAPTTMPTVVELSMELPSEMAVTIEQPVPSAPEPDRSVDASLAMVAAAVPDIAAMSEDHPMAMPASMPAVAQLSMEIPSLDMRAATDENVPAPEPAGSFEPSVAFAAIAPMVHASRGSDRHECGRRRGTCTVARGACQRPPDPASARRLGACCRIASCSGASACSGVQKAPARHQAQADVAGLAPARTQGGPQEGDASGQEGTKESAERAGTR